MPQDKGTHASKGTNDDLSYMMYQVVIVRGDGMQMEGILAYYTSTLLIIHFALSIASNLEDRQPTSKRNDQPVTLTLPRTRVTVTLSDKKPEEYYRELGIIP